jgi:hypothetical protein
LLALELFVRRWRRCRCVRGRILGVRTRGRGLRRRRPPSGGRRWWRVRRRTPRGGGSTVRRGPRRRRAVARGRPCGSAVGIEPFGRATLVALRIGRRERRGCLGLPPLRRRSGRRPWRRGLILRRLTPLRWRLLRLGRRRVLLLRWWCSPLSGRRCRRWWRYRRGRVVRRRTLRAGRRRPRAWRCRSQGRAARKAKLAGGLVSGATPRADDHESDSRKLRTPPNRGGPARAQHTRFRLKRREIARGSLSRGVWAQGPNTTVSRTFGGWGPNPPPRAPRRF